MILYLPFEIVCCPDPEYRLSSGPGSLALRGTDPSGRHVVHPGLAGSPSSPTAFSLVLARSPDLHCVPHTWITSKVWNVINIAIFQVISEIWPGAVGEFWWSDPGQNPYLHRIKRETKKVKKSIKNMFTGCLLSLAAMMWGRFDSTAYESSIHCHMMWTTYWGFRVCVTWSNPTSTSIRCVIVIVSAHWFREPINKIHPVLKCKVEGRRPGILATDVSRAWDLPVSTNLNNWLTEQIFIK